MIENSSLWENAYRQPAKVSFDVSDLERIEQMTRNGCSSAGQTTK